MTTPRRGNIEDLLTTLLDRRYDRAARRVVEAIANSTSGGVIGRRLDELDAEIARLAANNQRLTPTNAVVRALISDLEDVMRRNANRIDGVAEDLQAIGIDAGRSATRQLALPGITNQQLEALGIAWNVPDPEAVAELVRLVDSPEFAAMLDEYASDLPERVRRLVIRGVVSGANPRTTARAIRELVDGFAGASAQNIMRTLQLQSYRSATAIHQQANSHILEYVVRVAVLDVRTCLSCIALHGTRLEVGERVLDHHQGRCTSIGKVRGRELPVSLVEGERWWDVIGAERRAQQLSLVRTPAKREALESGAVRLRDFVQSYDDRLFGEMIREASLVGVLGDAAQQFYVRNRR